VRSRQGWAQPTIKTLLNRLMKKGLIRSSREEGRQLYRPQITREAFVRGEFAALASRLYDGDRAALMRELSD
jgi:predicted transcriptional regulator